MSNDEQKPSSKAKGSILEDLVARIHESPAITGLPQVKVETRQRLPSIRAGSTRRREVDVLLSSEVAGYPVRIAFSCKNEAEKVSTADADEFLSSLDDVGIPRVHGVFVTPTGYTSDALRLLQENGVRPLLFSGLNAERLAAEVLEAVQAMICMVAEWRTIQVFEACGTDGTYAAPSGMVASDLVVIGEPPAELGKALPLILDHAWQVWIANRIPEEAGEHYLFIRLLQRKEGRDELRAHYFVTLSVFALVGQLAGTATSVALRNAGSEAVEKIQITTQIPRPESALALRRMDTEEEIRQHLASSKGVRITQRVRVPRLLSGACYWPPSQEALERVMQLRKAGMPVTFSSVEGPDLSRAWDFIKGRQGPQSPPAG